MAKEIGRRQEISDILTKREAITIDTAFQTNDATKRLRYWKDGIVYVITDISTADECGTQSIVLKGMKEDQYLDDICDEEEAV